MILAAFRGDNEAARALIEGVSEGSRALGQGLGIQVAEWMLAVLCNGYGRFEETLPAAHRASDDSPELWVSAWATPELLEAAVRTGRSEIARDALKRVNASTEVARTESAAGIRARSHALLSEGELAEKLYLESIERLARTRLRPELARAHLLYGEWLRNEQRRADALAQLRAAHDQFTSLGMQGFAERARAELGTVGVRTRAKVVESREELTAQERQIARLAAERLSNPEIGARLFLSPRTVEWHLHKVFTKLGIRSRRELADALPETA
jgi:DNA-binding CsgD family transcriptional regulator